MCDAKPVPRRRLAPARVWPAPSGPLPQHEGPSTMCGCPSGRRASRRLCTNDLPLSRVLVASSWSASYPQPSRAAPEAAPPAPHPADPPLVRQHARRTSGPAANTSPAHLIEARHGARDPLLMGGRRSGGGHERSGHSLRETVQAEREHAGDDAVHDRIAADQVQEGEQAHTRPGEHRNPEQH